MGFWHTGYMEFHEPAGLEVEVTLSPPKYSCTQCGLEFENQEKLRFHRFEVHRHRRPTLYFKGREIGANRLAVRSVVLEKDIVFEDCEKIHLNGKLISPSELGRALGKVRSDVCRVTLSGDGGDASFEFDIQIPLPGDLGGVDREFIRLARGRRLDMRAVEDFISAAGRFSTAMNYCDGICAYLYGVMAKENAGGCGIPYGEYVNRFNKSSGELAAYDRVCAKTIGALIAFHFNHFEDALRMLPDGRVGYVAKTYRVWLDGQAHALKHTTDINAIDFSLESLVTDLDTERLLQWCVLPPKKLESEVQEIEQALESVGNEFDRNKLHILLAQVYAYARLHDKAAIHAKALRSLAGFDKWAESMIRQSQVSGT